MIAARALTPAADLPKRPVRLTVAEAAEEGRKHPITVRRALESGELHGSQRVKGGRWTIEESCLSAWLAGETCEHQRATATSTVVPFRRRRA
ncbi:helix-turn-helix domain-containing protein [Cellulosimicrobium sp. JZ28]|uniref:helix-turn-helix domain-containing protein n=1 Tax=Cellulosimicrobium sp. JZ28 TaxID=1906273 RepID=UPI00188DB412|nr:helix-turn-helix domain-containing protein [Cellulosimicrobium sp. JZ28]